MSDTVTDIPFDQAVAVTQIRYRLHTIDVGFNLRAEKIKVQINPTDDPIRVSYQGRDGERRVMEGPLSAVLRRLRARGYRFRLESRAVASTRERSLS